MATTLHALIAELVQKEPHHHDGYAWAARPQPWLAAELGISVETLRRRIKQPPIIRQRTRLNQRVTTLLRIAVPGEAKSPAIKSKRHLQNTLAAIWREKTNRPLAPRGFGHMAGLVDHWGMLAPNILKTILSDWPAFMAGVKLAITPLPDGVCRYYKYPSSSVVLKFHAVGVEMYVMKQQEQGKLFDVVLD